MSGLEGILYGLLVVLTPTNLLAALVGGLAGTFVGVLPGLGPTATIAMLLPISFLVDPTAGLIMMAGIYYGAMYGGSTTSILLNLPGEAASVVTCIEGNLMAKRGRAGAALAVAAVGSFVAGTLGVVAVTLAAPFLAGMALMFGPPEFMVLGIVSLIALIPLLGGSKLDNAFMAVLGLALATIGLDQLTGVPRFSFGRIELSQGVNLTPLAMGLFGIAELLLLAEAGTKAPALIKARFRELFPSVAEWKRATPAILRGSFMGLPIGLIPGSATVLSAFLAFGVEKKIAGPNSDFGRGAIEGVAAPESANNAAATTAFIPMLALGIPFGSATALMIAALMMHGVHPGPLLMTQHPELFWGVIASMYVGNFVLVVLNYPLVGLWTNLLRTPRPVMAASIALFMLVGTFSVDTSLFDLTVLLVLGVVGYVFGKMRYNAIPLVLGFVLGIMIESAFRQSLIMFQGDLSSIYQRPIVVALAILGLLPFVLPRLIRLVRPGTAAWPLAEAGES